MRSRVLALGAVWCGVAHAEPLTHGSWSRLVPWRTYIVIDDVTPAQHWFVVDEVPGLGQRCEIRVDAKTDSAAPLVVCGQPTLPDGVGQVLPKQLQGAAARAKAALATSTDLDKKALKGTSLRFVGTLRRVSFRQVVVVEPHEAANEARALSMEATWDVDVDSGRVDHGVIPPRVGHTPLCAVGLHPGCDAPPRLAAYEPPPRYDGFLLDPRDEGASEAAVGVLDGVIRDVALSSEQGTFASAAPRAVTGGRLPGDYDGGLGVRLHVRSQRASGQGDGGFVTVDLPLNEAAFHPVSVAMPIDGVPATVEVDLRLQEHRLIVRIRPDSGRYVEAEAEVTCDLQIDGDRAALARGCPVAWAGQWLQWVDPRGAASVMVQADTRIEPLPGPSRGPKLREEGL